MTLELMTIELTIPDDRINADKKWTNWGYKNCENLVRVVNFNKITTLLTYFLKRSLITRLSDNLTIIVVINKNNEISKSDSNRTIK